MHTTKSYNSYLNTPSDKIFKFSPVDENTIINGLKNNASTGHDNISNKLLQFSKNMIVKPLTLIVNQTLMSGKFTSELKSNPYLKKMTVNNYQITVQSLYYRPYQRYLRRLYSIK